LRIKVSVIRGVGRKFGIGSGHGGEFLLADFIFWPAVAWWRRRDLGRAGREMSFHGAVFRQSMNRFRRRRGWIQGFTTAAGRLIGVRRSVSTEEQSRFGEEFTQALTRGVLPWPMRGPDKGPADRRSIGFRHDHVRALLWW
jgi:hypothetical protein